MTPADPASLDPFREEIRQAVSYERGLAVKALLALAVVAALVVLRLLGI